MSDDEMQLIPRRSGNRQSTEKELLYRDGRIHKDRFMDGDKFREDRTIQPFDEPRNAKEHPDTISLGRSSSGEKMQNWIEGKKQDRKDLHKHEL